MTACRWICLATRVPMLAFVLSALSLGLVDESWTQIKPSMKIKLNVLPSVTISKMTTNAQSPFVGELSQLKELTTQRLGKGDSVYLAPGFSISAFENITVLLSYTTPSKILKSTTPKSGVKIMCGYLNDGTAYFSRAKIAQKSPIQFTLRDNHLLKRSMINSDPQYVAYVFFLIDKRKEVRKNEGPLPFSTVTVEFI